MGTWNTGAFENDNALDWLSELDKSKNKDFIMNTLQQGLSDEADSAEQAEAIAASSLILAAGTEPVCEVIEEVKEWIVSNAYVPNVELIKLAIKVTDLIKLNSELKDVWMDSDKDSFDEWVDNSNMLTQKLKELLNLPLPNRRKKKKSIPRNFDKLAILVAEEGNKKALDKIIKKINALNCLESNSAETEYLTPLCLMSKYGVSEPVKLLISSGAKVTYPKGLQPITVACQFNHFKIAKLLIDAGAVPFETKWLDTATGQTVDSSSSNDKNVAPFYFSSALFESVKHGSVELVKLILDSGTDINMKELNGETLLHMATSYSNFPVIELLLSLAVDVNKVKSFNETALYIASGIINYEILALLIDAGADPNIPDRYGITCLDLLKKSLSEDEENKLAIEKSICLLLKHKAIDGTYFHN